MMKLILSVLITFISMSLQAHDGIIEDETGLIGVVSFGYDKSNLDAIKAIRFSGKSKKVAAELINQL